MDQEPDSKKPEFNKAAEVDFYTRFTTIKSQFSAMEVRNKAERILNKASDQLAAVIEKNRQTPSHDYRPMGAPAFDPVKQAKVQIAHRMYERRQRWIENAKASELHKVEHKQQLRQRAERTMGRSLSQEFRRRR